MPIFYIAKTSFTQFGTYTYDVNKNQINSISKYYLSRIAFEQAKKYDAIFEKIKTASSLMGREASNIYQNMEMLSKAPLGGTLSFKKNQKSKIFFSPQHEDVITAYWGGDTLSDDIQKELNALSHLKPTLIKVKTIINESIATHIITDSGFGFYYTLNSDAKNACYNLPSPLEFDLRDGEPVTIFTKNDKHKYDTQWTRIYKDDIINGLMITATTPIYDKNGRFKGITGIDIPVEHIISDLTDGAFISENAEENILFAFLQNSEGQIIAFPKKFFELFGLKIDYSNYKNSSDIINYSLKDSSILSVRNIDSPNTPNHPKLKEVIINNEKYILAFGDLESVDWRIVIVTREADITKSVFKTKLAMEDSLESIWKNLVVLSVIIIVILILFTIYAIRMFIAPIEQFIEATHTVSKGDFSLSLDSNRNDEIGVFAKSFNSMIYKLKTAETIEKKYAEKLENQIQIRTIELQQSYTELEEIKNGLENTVEQRTMQLKKLNENLINTEEKTRSNLANDLHDTIAQTLALSVSRIKTIKEEDNPNIEMLSAVQENIEQSLNEIRQVINQLCPSVVKDFDIATAIGFLVEEINEKFHADITYINNTEDPITIDEPKKITLYRAANEIILNILKHSGVKEAKVELLKNENTVLLTFEDNGVGFNMTAIKSNHFGSFGLYGLSERCKNMGGSAQISSIPGKGTKAVLSIPI
ncbi:MAG: HAMP domain-containing protein [archaeon]|nr:HAMP domain-containing protein [archaeon]